MRSSNTSMSSLISSFIFFTSFQGMCPSRKFHKGYPLETPAFANTKQKPIERQFMKERGHPRLRSACEPREPAMDCAAKHKRWHTSTNVFLVQMINRDLEEKPKPGARRHPFDARASICIP